MSPARSSRVAVAVASACALAACTGSADSIDVDGFSAGACRDLADTVQEVDEVLREVDDDDLEPAAAADRLEAAQDELKPRRAQAEQPVSAAITELVTRMGFFRISVDSNGFDGSQVGDVRTALEALAEECRG